MIDIEKAKKEDYINKIINRFDFKNQEIKEKIEEIRKIANVYIIYNRRKNKRMIEWAKNY